MSTRGKRRDVRTTLTLDADVYEAASYLARVSGRRLGKVVSELARRGLGPPGPVRRKNKRRFPTFEVPQGAPIVPASRIQRLIDHEGLF
jgi:hypothetical protein